MKSEDSRYIGVGCVSLYVNRSANIWSEFTMYLSRVAQAIEGNYSDAVPIQVVVVFVIPGIQNPVEFSGVRITIKSKKGIKRVQVEAAVPDIPFPEDNPNQAKKIVLDLMLESVKEVETYANRNRIIKGELDGARNVIQELWKGWDVSSFSYKIPEGLTYYDLPRVNEFTTRVFIKKLPEGGERHYNMLLDQEGNEVA